MSSALLTPFQRHLSFYAVPPERTKVTILSAIRGALSLGLNFPFALGIALTYRFYWAQNPLYPPNVLAITGGQPTHLQFAQLSQSSYTPDELLKLYTTSEACRSGWHGMLDRSHIENIARWMVGKDGKITREDVEKFQAGQVLETPSRRRKNRDHVLPFRHGGPLGVAAHSWAVRKIFGVHVYEAK